MIDIAKNDDETIVREPAVKKVDDISVLRDIAENDSNSTISRIASKQVIEREVEPVNDESVLIDIAKNDSFWYVRGAAVKKINDKSVLIYIAKNDSDYLVRKRAVEKIIDESVLIDIAKNDSNNKVRREAAKKINNENFLADTIKNHSDGYYEAINKIDNKTLLEMVKKDNYLLLDKDILNKLKDSGKIGEIPNAVTVKNSTD